MLSRSAFILAFALVAAGCSALADSFTLEDGSTHDKNISLVNGRIEIGADCRVNGKVSNVNGRIQIDEGTRVLDISNVNGRVSLAEGVAVDGDVSTVNGRIELASSVRVSGEVESVNGRINAADGVVIENRISTVNGRIEMRSARAARVVTNNGDIHLDDGTVISGEVRVRKSQGVSFNLGSAPRVVIGRNVRVEGPMTFEHEVELFVHESATVGEITGARPVAYSGDEP